MPVLIDTGVLYAFLNEDDQRHEAARRLVRALASGRFGTPWVLDLVVAEFFTLVRARRGPPQREDLARRLVLGDNDARFMDIRAVRLDDLSSIAELFVRTRRRGFSFTDAALVTLGRRWGVDAIASFDSGLEGFDVAVLSDAR